MNRVLVEIFTSRTLTTQTYVVTVESYGETTMQTFESEDSAMNYAKQAAQLIGAKLIIEHHDKPAQRQDDIQQGGGADNNP